MKPPMDTRNTRLRPKRAVKKPASGIMIAATAM